jgi:hypothetical protein
MQPAKHGPWGILPVSAIRVVEGARQEVEGGFELRLNPLSQCGFQDVRVCVCVCVCSVGVHASTYLDGKRKYKIYPHRKQEQQGFEKVKQALAL